MNYISINQNNPIQIYKDWAALAAKNTPETKYIQNKIHEVKGGNERDASMALIASGAMIAGVGASFLFAGILIGPLVGFSGEPTVFIGMGTTGIITGLALAAIGYRVSNAYKALQEILHDKDGTLINELYIKGKREALEQEKATLNAKHVQLVALQNGELERQIEENRVSLQTNEAIRKALQD